MPQRAFIPLWTDLISGKFFILMSTDPPHHFHSISPLGGDTGHLCLTPPEQKSSVTPHNPNNATGFRMTSLCHMCVVPRRGPTNEAEPHTFRPGGNGAIATRALEDVTRHFSKPQPHGRAWDPKQRRKAVCFMPQRPSSTARAPAGRPASCRTLAHRTHRDRAAEEARPRERWRGAPASNLHTSGCL